ncbi:MAG: ester cyclase [Halobacteriales archaeon]|nr:ester cyclase [Halobacteriales archaeon]
MRPPKTIQTSGNVPAAGRKNERVARRLVESVYGTGRLVHIDDLISADYVGRWVGTGGLQVGSAGLRNHAARFRLAFGRLDLTVEASHECGGTVEVSWSARGYLERPFLGVQPTVVSGRAGEEPHGPAVTLSAVTRGRIRAGRLVESTTVWTLDGDGISRSSPVEQRGVIAGGDSVAVAPEPVSGVGYGRP